MKQRFAGFGRDRTHLNIVSTSDLRSPAEWKIQESEDSRIAERLCHESKGLAVI
jgi:hypothetical protein